MTPNAYASPGRRYKVHRAIGRGGFGTVYRAEMLGDDGFVRAVALKVLNASVGETAEVARRFRDEARVLGLLRHRAIVHVDGLVYLGDRQALVMEYIDGADLGRIMKLGPIAPGPAVEIIGEVANALDVAYHTPGPDGRPLGLLHRDVKPSNVRITPVGEVKVLDFGVARADFSEREAFTKSYLLGSDGYMGPERFEGEDGPATDVYSLGVVLLEMLTGKAFGPTSIRPSKLAARVDAAILAAGGFHPPLEDLVRQMISFEPHDRPSAAAVERRAWDLRRDLEGERLRDWARPNVAEAAAKPVKVAQDDLSGQILVESKGDTPAPGRPKAPVQKVMPPAPFQNVSRQVLEDEWADELPTVVVEVVQQAPPKKATLGPRSSFDRPVLASVAASGSGASSAGKSAPSPLPPSVPDPVASDARLPSVDQVLPRSDSLVSSYPRVAPRSSKAHHSDTASGVRRRPRASSASATESQPQGESGLIWVAAVVGAAAAVMVGVIVLWSLSDADLVPVDEVVETPAPLDLSPVPPSFVGSAPTDTKGSVSITGDARSVRLVSVKGRRHAGGLLNPGTYIVSADFGQGAKMSDRFDLEVGQRVTVECSHAARACSTYVH